MRRAPQRGVPLLDVMGAKYRRLLYDPCYADMVAPTYAGAGTGQYRRMRSLIQIPGTAVEGCWIFQFGNNSLWAASHILANAGTNYTFNAATTLFNSTALTTSGTQFRCLAGCVKVRYTGAEQTRAGTIGLASVTSPFRLPGNVSTAITDLARCPVINRTQEVMHEAKFIPNQRDEEMSVQLTSEGNSTIAVVFRGVPAGTIQLESTAIYEVEPNDENIPLSTLPAASRNTLNQVLASLGPAVNWAYGHVVAPTIRAVAGQAMQTAGNFVSSAQVAMPLLTL